MERPADESRSEISMVTRRDRSLVALLEIGAAVFLIFSVFLPWFQVTYLNGAGVAPGPGSASISWMDYRTAYIDWAQFVASFLIPFGAIAALAAALVGLALPGRGEVVAVLAAFAVSGVGAMSQFSALNSGSMDSPGFSATSPGPGMWLFAAVAAFGAILAVVDLALAGSSTFAWRALREPSTKRYGLFLAWAGGLAVALVVGLFPMFPRWWLIGFFALLVAPLWVRARTAR
jgi:hypothetical protein